MENEKQQEKEHVHLVMGCPTNKDKHSRFSANTITHKATCGHCDKDFTDDLLALKKEVDAILNL